MMIGSLAVSAAGSAQAQITYNPTVLVDGFAPRVNDTDLNNVKISWSIYRVPGFDAYHVLRSTTEDPQFPEDSIEKITSDTKRETYDYDADLDTIYYYRVCVEANKDVFCSRETEQIEMKNDVEVEEVSYGVIEDFENFRLTVTKTHQGYIELDWKKIRVDGFQLYAFMRSTTNNDLVYPKDTPLEISIDFGDRSFIDTNPPKTGIVYYRICMPTITDTFCSRTVEFNMDTEESLYFEKSKAEVNIDSESVTSTENSEETTSTETTSTTTEAETSTETEVEAEVVAETKSDEPNIDDFTDISRHKYNDAITYLVKNKIVKGYPKGDKSEYRPSQAVNRAEFIKILVETKFGDEYINATTQTDCFSDLDKNNPQWFATYMCFAKEKDIIGGYADGSVKAGNNINFVEAAKILVNTYGIPTQPVDNQPWYVPFVKALEGKNYIPPTIASESKLVDRAELAELIWRIQESVQNKSAKKFDFEEKKEEPAPVVVEKPAEEPEGPSQKASEATFSTDEYADFTRFTHKEFTLMYPAEWKTGRKWDRNVFSEDEAYISSLNTGESHAPYMYMMVYPLFISERVGADAALAIENDFGHQLVKSEYMDINGIRAYRREYNAAANTAVTGRTTAVEENIVQYTFRFEGTVYVLQYFEAAKTDKYLLDVFDKVAKSFLIK